MAKIFRWVFPLSLAGLAFSGCASKPTVEMAERQRARKEARLTSMEIAYTLGHNTYRIVTVGGWGSIRTEILNDAHLISEGELSAQTYTDLVLRAQDLAQNLGNRREKPTAKTCRTPFTLSLAQGETKTQVEGCRGGPEGAEIGKLIKEMEFLLHSEPEANRIPAEAEASEKGPVRN